MAGLLTLTFNETPEINVNESIFIYVNTGTDIVPLNEIFRETRLANFQVTIPNTYTSAEIASNFTTAWNLDYSFTGGVGNLIATSVNGVVGISLTNPTWSFETPTGTAIDNGGVTYTVSNLPIEVDKVVTINSYSSSVGNECTKVDLELLVEGGTSPYYVYVDNVLSVSAQTSPIDIQINRGLQRNIKVVDSVSKEIGVIQSDNTRNLISEDISVSVANYTSGSTVTVNLPYISDSVSSYEYSLDNITYQVSNVFTGQPPSTYTMYVKDGLGCVVSNIFVVDGVTTVTETVFDISEINPIRYSLVNDNKKNQLNQLSFNDLRKVSYPYIHQYLETDVITTQFKTNAKYINVYTLDKQGIEASLTPIKKTVNIGVEVKTTSTYYDFGNNKSALYFGVVNSLDYLTSAFIKEVNYGYSLPLWASSVGNLVTIEGIGQVPINYISYDDSKNSFVAVFDIAYNGDEVTKNVWTTYNIQPYELYEFDTSMTLDLFNIVIKVGKDSDNIKFTYISECIKKVEDSNFLFEIDYWDDENKGKFVYQTEIKNKLRLNGYQDYVGEQSTSGYNGDEEYFVTDNIVYDVQAFTFNRLSPRMAHKLRLVFAHEHIKINGLIYKLASEPEIQGNANNNIKNFVVNLKQGGEQFLTSEQEIISSSVEDLIDITDVPSTLTDGTNFIKL